VHFAWGRGLPLLYRPRRAPPGTEGDSSSSGRVLPIGAEAAAEAAAGR